MKKTANGWALSGVLLGIVALTPAAAFLACGGGKPAEAPAAAAPSASASTASAGGSAAASDTTSAPSASASAPAAPQAAPLGAVLITDASVVQKLFDAASASPAATPKTGGAAGADPLAKGLRELAKAQAKGMEPDGPLLTGTLKEKEHLHADITLKAGKCYALVGYSLPTGVKDLDVHLLVPPGILSAQDTTDDNKPVVGKAPDALCPSAGTAITYKVDIFADQGAGEVAVQLYSKAGK